MLTENEILKTRIIIAKSIKIDPDSIEIISKENNNFYLINGFKNMNFCLKYEEIPTVEDVREEIKDCYLGGCEVDFDIEYGKKDNFDDRFDLGIDFGPNSYQISLKCSFPFSSI